MIHAAVAGAVAMYLATRTRLGPLYTGEPIAAVRRTLGAGSQITQCLQPNHKRNGDCPLALKYGDGENVLKVDFDGESKLITLEVTFRSSQRGVSLAHLAKGAFAKWTWNGVDIAQQPTAAIVGWTGATSQPHDDCFTVFEGLPRPSGARLVTTFACANSSKRIAQFTTGFVDP